MSQVDEVLKLFSTDNKTIMFVLTNSLLQDARYNLQIVLNW